MEVILRYRLAPYMHLGYDRTSMCLKLGYGSIQQIIENENLFDTLIKFMDFLQEYRTFTELQDYLSQQEAVSKNDIEYILDLFLKNNYVIREDECVDCMAYLGRDLLFYGLYTSQPSYVIDKLKHKKVAIIGCGGVGSNIATILARKGIGQMILVDHDVIETSNLNRNFIFTLRDIGKAKSVVLRDAIIKTNPLNLEIQTVTNKLDSPNKLSILADVDFVVLSCDDYQFIRFITPFLYKSRIPHIIAGYLEDIIIWGPLFNPCETCCYYCFSENNIDSLGNFGQELNNIVSNINNNYIAPAIFELTMISSSFAALDTIKFLGQIGEVFSLGKRVGLWSHNMRTQIQECQKKENCSICGLN